MHSTMATAAGRAASSGSRSAPSAKAALSFTDYVARFGGGPTSTTKTASSSLAPVAASSSSNSLSPLARTFPSLRAVRVQTPHRYEGKSLSALLRRHLPALKFHNPKCNVDVARWAQGSRGKAKVSGEGEGEGGPTAGRVAKLPKKERAKKVTLEFDNLVPREIVVANKNETQLTREILDMCMFVSKSVNQQKSGAAVAAAAAASQPASSAPASA